MQGRVIIFSFAYISILCISSIESSAISARSRCSSGIKTVSNGRKPRAVTPVPTLKDDYGLEDDRFPLAVKITGDFEYIRISLDFGSWPYETPLITPEHLGLEKDGKWHQLMIELKPSNKAGIDTWHFYITSDKTKHTIDTTYEWHWSPYHPNSVNGKSYWIPRGNATVCNAVDSEKRAAGYGNYGHLKIGQDAANSARMVERSLFLEVLLLPLLLLMRMAAAQAVE